MSSVNNYVNIMRRQGTMRASVNPNSEMSMLKQELIQHYKGNPPKAWALINGIEGNAYTNVSAEQRMHYDAAVIAMRGYNTPNTTQTTTPNVPSQINELQMLKSAGWEELNKPKEQVLLQG